METIVCGDGRQPVVLGVAVGLDLTQRVGDGFQAAGRGLVGDLGTQPLDLPSAVRRCAAAGVERPRCLLVELLFQA